VVNDSGKLVYGCGYRFGCAEPGFHASKIIPQEGLTSMKSLRCHSQSQRSPFLRWHFADGVPHSVRWSRVTLATFFWFSGRELSRL
jgi:hypothetical protein